MDANERRGRAAAEAAEWWVRFESGELSRAEREEFVDWLRESATHVAEMIRMAEVHGGLERFNDWQRVSTEGWDAPENVVSLDDASSRRAREASSTEESQRRASPRSESRRWWLAAAAAAVVVVFGGWMFFASQAQVIETGRGERRGVTLADGSVIQIDPQSRLRIRFEKDLRNISLERGRVLFRVAHDVQRPFVVQAGVTQVRAVGTQFGVEQAREGIIVTVAEGKVMANTVRSGGDLRVGLRRARSVVERRPAVDGAERRPGHGGEAGRQRARARVGRRASRVRQRERR